MLLATLVASFLMPLPCAHAVEDKASDAEVVQTLRKAQAMIRQMAAERQKIEQAYALKEAESQALRQRIQILEAQSQGLEKALSAAQHEQQRVNGAYRQQMTQARSLIQDSQRQMQASDSQSQKLASAYEGCRKKANSLKEVNEVLVRDMENETLWDSLVELEPLTGIGRVERENRLQEYRDRLRQAEGFQKGCD